MHSYKMSPQDKAKIDALNNPKIWKVLNDAIELMEPAEVLVFDETPEDIARVRQLAIDQQEEKKLSMEGHTIHYDGYNDQGRDKAHTGTLLPAGQTLSRGLEVFERESALQEVLEIMKGIMKGRTMLVSFFCLGPKNSSFTLNAFQITDSSYVMHSEFILYRPGYENFKNMKNKDDFFYFWHSQGELDERNTTVNVPKRRIYIDPLENRVLTVNNQYAGNSIAAKKLALRLAIYKANHEDWLAEHMFISAFYPIDKSRKTYFAGAYPSACGKTSTAMIPGASIVGDDIAYLRVGKDGDLRAVNIEKGIFGIIQDVNAKDDPVIYDALISPKELIFSNVLTTDDGKCYWIGMGKDIEIPKSGNNHSGKWQEGNVDKNGKKIPASHPNARFTLQLKDLSNVDNELDNVDGVSIGAILYGGRDSDTTVPVAECVDWNHGVFVGATIESETTTATLGAVGKRESSPMANMDFIIVPLGLYLTNHIKFGKRLKKAPRVYATNYFIKDEAGNYLNTKLDKKVWVLWAEGRVSGEYKEAIKTPIGHIPRYEDLKKLFSDIFNGKEYTKEEYVAQFSIRISKYLEKYERMEEQYKVESQMPDEFWAMLKQIREGLLELKAKHGEKVSPFDLS